MSPPRLGQRLDRRIKSGDDRGGPAGSDDGALRDIRPALPCAFACDKRAGAAGPGSFDHRRAAISFVEGRNDPMQAVQTLQPTLASALWPSSTRSGALRAAVLMVLGTVALWLSAKIQVPLIPV